MVLWWRMVQLELPLWSQSSTTSHTPIHYLQCRSSPLSCRLSRWPCNTSARYQTLPSPLLSAATPRRRWQPSSPTQNAGEDLVREIATTTHQLISRGTEVRFQWVQAHVCLSGNEKADRAAERGAKAVDSSSVTMKIGLADVSAELTKQAWKQWEKEFHPMATAKEWDDTSPPPPHLQGWSLLPRSAELHSSHRASSARGRLEMHVRTNGVWVWKERLVSRHVKFTCTVFSDPWLGSYTAWDSLCVQKAWQRAFSVKDGASYGLQPDTCPLATYL